MKYLALDIGQARVGVAVTDESGIIATPLTYLEVSHKLIADLGVIMAAERPDVVIFGIPRHQSGEEAAVAAQIRDFAETVKHEYNIEVDFEDESGTTIEAEKRLAERKVPREQYRQLVDAEAAAVILESYLAGHL
jgi:putative Holliday junction resolvase